MAASPTICGLYTRVSSRNQAERDYSSLESQREKLEAYCQSQDQYTIYRVYEDGGYSADTIHRPALTALLEDIREEAPIVTMMKCDVDTGPNSLV